MFFVLLILLPVLLMIDFEKRKVCESIKNWQNSDLTVAWNEPIPSFITRISDMRL